MDRVLYVKGGRAIEEAHVLFPRLGELPDGGPDKFLLAVLFYARNGVLRLASFGPKTKRVVVDGREVVEYGARSTDASRVARRMSFAGAAFAFLMDTVRLRPKRVLCGVDGPFALLAWAAARWVGAQFVFLAHNALALPSTSSVYRLAHRFVCRRADLVIAHGPYVWDEAVRLGAAPAQVVEFNNALDPEHAALVQRLPAKSSSAPEDVILYMGRVEEDKGVVDLFHAFRQLGRRPDLRLRFVGNGSANPLLRQLVQQYQMHEQVEVLGPVEFEAVFAHLKQAAVVVTPSQSRFPEGFCKSAMEAFYVGTPVIAPDYGPFPYMVKHEDNGLLYAPDDVAALAQALQRFFADAGLRSQLEQGARHWGGIFMHPETTFVKAVDRIFSQLNPPSAKQKTA